MRVVVLVKEGVVALNVAHVDGVGRPIEEELNLVLGLEDAVDVEFLLGGCSVACHEPLMLLRGVGLAGPRGMSILMR